MSSDRVFKALYQLREIGKKGALGIMLIPEPFLTTALGGAIYIILDPASGMRNAPQALAAISLATNPAVVPNVAHVDITRPRREIVHPRSLPINDNINAAGGNPEP